MPQRHEDTRENIYRVKIDLYNSANLLFTEIDNIYFVSWWLSNY